MTGQKSIRLGGTAKSPEDVQVLHSLGLTFAEIPIKDPIQFSKILDRYRKLQEHIGMLYLCHGPREGDPNDVHSLEQSYFPKIMALFPIMEALAMPLLTIHLWMDRRFVKERVLEYKIGLLKRIIAKAKKTGVALCLENLSESAQDLKRTFEEIPQLNLTLDLGHAQLLTDENRSKGFITAFPKRIRHVHLHDNRGGGSQKDDLHLPPGKGIIDIESAIKGLEIIGYNGTMTLELKPLEVAECLDRVKAML